MLLFPTIMKVKWNNTENPQFTSLWLRIYWLVKILRQLHRVAIPMNSSRQVPQTLTTFRANWNNGPEQMLQFLKLHKDLNHKTLNVNETKGRNKMNWVLTTLNPFYRYLTHNPFLLGHSLSGADFIDRKPKDKCLLKNERPKELLPLLLAPNLESCSMQLSLFWRSNMNFPSTSISTTARLEILFLVLEPAFTSAFPAEHSPWEQVGQDGSNLEASGVTLSKHSTW